MTTPLASSTFSPVLADHFGSASLRRDALAVLAGAGLVGILAQVRSEERRVGKEC